MQNVKGGKSNYSMNRECIKPSIKRERFAISLFLFCNVTFSGMRITHQNAAKKFAKKFGCQTFKKHYSEQINFSYHFLLYNKYMRR